jgi:arylsulfatase A-like enzyme
MKKHPNILFIFSDQHRKHSLGCYGNEQVINPNFDRFAGEGLRFGNCVSTSPLCVPMRGGILSGMHAWNHQALSNDLPIDPEARSIATVLNENNYHTGYIGKWHLGGIPRNKAIPAGERLGFSEWKVANCNHAYDKGYYYDENNVRHEMRNFESIEQTDLALDFIRRNSANESPWGLVLSWGPPHAPFNTVPQKYFDIYDPAEIKLRDNVPDTGILLSKTRPLLTAADIRRQYHAYYALISLLDECFGRLLDELDKLGVRDDTIVVYTSDHGDMLGSNGLCRKQLPHEESIGVPLIVSRKGKTFVGTSDELISLTDIPVSLAALAGMPWGTKTDGEDLSKLFTDSADKGPNERLIYNLVPCHQAEDCGYTEWCGLRTHKFTYAEDGQGNDKFLFKNDEDPFQMHNLCRDEKYKVEKQRLAARLDEILKDNNYEFRPWRQMLIEDGCLDKWNESQTYFSRERLERPMQKVNYR